MARETKRSPPPTPLHRPDIDYRSHPERYAIGRGEQGVLTVEPYKSELLPHWRFKTPEEARRSADTLFAMFQAYCDQGDVVGADMARKFLQMGWTRSRRYANHRSGRKYAPATGMVLPIDPDPVKAASAAIFWDSYQRAKHDPRYQALLHRHRQKSA